MPAFLSELITKFKSKLHKKVAQSPPVIDDEVEVREPLVYEFTQEQEETDTVQSGSNETSDNETEFTDEIDALNTYKSNILGMFLVATGTGLFCTIGAVVQMSSASLLELMLGRLVIQNIMSWALWLINPYQIKGNEGDNMNWYGDEPHRVNVWIRGFLLFCSGYVWWCALELLPIGICYTRLYHM